MIHTVRCADCRTAVTVACPPGMKLSDMGKITCFACTRRAEAGIAEAKRTARRREAGRRRAAHYRSLMDRLENVETALDRLAAERDAA